jgi:glyoxylase-like metal-dependent hydrolase (beta-lactamase superfamily II)
LTTLPSDDLVAPGVRSIRLQRVFAYLLDTDGEDGLTLVDCGYAGSSKAIEAALVAKGRRLADVRRVVCSHGHPDHAGGARELADRGIEVLIHPADARNLPTTWRAALRRPARGRFFAAMTPPLDRWTPIQDGDVIPALGGLRVIHTPGHTPGSVCLYAARDRVLFVGDVLNCRFGRTSYASRIYSDDYPMACASMRPLADLDVAVIVFGHYPPLRSGANEAIAALAEAATAATPSRDSGAGD